MRYPYQCKKCGHDFEVIKAVSDIDREEFCEKCSGLSERYVGLSFFYGADDWGKEEYCPALGCVVKNRKHRAKLAKERGLEEIGNTHPDKLHAWSEKAQQDKIEKRWAEED